MNASGNKGIPSDERVYFKILLPKSHNKQKSIPVFVGCQWSVGKITDSIAEVAKVSFIVIEKSINIIIF